MELPCKNCVTLSICKAEAREPDYIKGPFTVNPKTLQKCSLINSKYPGTIIYIFSYREIRNFLNPDIEKMREEMIK